MLDESATSQPHSFADGFLRDTPMALFNDSLPGHTTGNQLQNIRDKNPGAREREFTVADFRISNNVITEYLPLHGDPSSVSTAFLASSVAVNQTT